MNLLGLGVMAESTQNVNAGRLACRGGSLSDSPLCSSRARAVISPGLDSHPAPGPAVHTGSLGSAWCLSCVLCMLLCSVQRVQ